MSSKILLKFLGGCLALFLVVGISITESVAQSVAGKTETPASQIIAPVLEDSSVINTVGQFDNVDVDRHTHVTITNTSTEPVTVHIQFLKADDDCEEIDFFDTFTGNDTHVYALDETCTTNDDGSPCPISVADRDGLWVVTPVVSEGDPTAIAFNHLHGVVDVYNNNNAGDDFETTYRFNAIGRTAIDLASEAPLATGTEEAPTTLDGLATGYENIIPDSISYHYHSFLDIDPTYADLILVAISDTYDNGSEGYKAVNGEASYGAFKVCNDDEVCISCSSKPFDCIDLYGINETVPALDQDDPIICDEAGNPSQGLDQLLHNSSDANVIFGVLGLTTSDLGGAAHVFVK